MKISNKGKYLTIKNPEGYETGAFYTNGSPVIAYRGEMVETRITLKDPISLIVDTDEKGNEIVAYLGIGAAKAFDAFHNKRKTYPQRKHFGPNETAIYEAWQRLGGKSVKIEDVLVDAMNHLPAPSARKRDRRREFLLRAVRNLVDKGEFIKIREGTVVNKPDSCDLIEG